MPCWLAGAWRRYHYLVASNKVNKTNKNNNNNNNSAKTAKPKTKCLLVVVGSLSEDFCFWEEVCATSGLIDGCGQQT